LVFQAHQGQVQRPDDLSLLLENLERQLRTPFKTCDYRGSTSSGSKNVEQASNDCKPKGVSFSKNNLTTRKGHGHGLAR